MRGRGSRRQRLLVLLGAVSVLGMGSVPDMSVNTWNVFVRTAGTEPEFVILSGRERQRRLDPAAVMSDARRLHRLSELTKRLAQIPVGDWVVIQYLDSQRLPDPQGDHLRTQLRALCRSLRHRCAFAI